MGAAVVDAPAADITLRIGEVSAELGRGHTVRTLAYNGQVPGPLLRMTEGRPVVVDVVNETARPEMVHWHGFHIPADVDGAHEEGTPMVQARDRRQYRFTPRPSGTRWYHTHAMAGHDLRIGTYSGEFGMVVVAARSDPARYDVEVPIVLHEWEPFFASGMNMDVDYKVFSVNGKILGAGEPVRVRRGQRALFRVLNASATMSHRLAMAGHSFVVTALDGNAVAAPRRVAVLELAPGERVDAVVEMNTPGVWILGETDDGQRAAGAGIVIEYAGSSGKPQWAAAAKETWNYQAFGVAKAAVAAEARIPLVIEPGKDGNLWAINGKSYPQTDLMFLRRGARNRLVFENRSTMDHPVHLHRHSMELAGCGVVKDVILVPARRTVEADVMANNPGPSLFHCHQQFHMDFGFMALMSYSE
ncbi:MAG TPA: multicopper oxidase domain-containing protein [Candidatus Sulfopaludibacter sp.]|nr:multicopper oxidase domain-containing protein [Candidatus Sulfopaludibacter sp.]